MTATVVLAAAAHAEVDTDFAKQPHTNGIYEERDDNAGIASITAVLAATLLSAPAAAIGRTVQWRMRRRARSTDDDPDLTTPCRRSLQD